MARHLLSQPGVRSTTQILDQLRPDEIRHAGLDPSLQGAMHYVLALMLTIVVSPLRLT